jgi:hypothetical protein
LRHCDRLERIWCEQTQPANSAAARWIDGIAATVRTARKPRALRLQWPDGTIVVAGFEAKGPAKSAVALTHTKLRDKGSVEGAKKAWSERLDSLQRLIAGRR